MGVPLGTGLLKPFPANHALALLSQGRQPLTSKVFPVTSNSGGTKAPSGSSGERKRRCCDHTLARQEAALGEERAPAPRSPGADSASCPSPALVPEGRKPPPSLQVWD